MQMGSRVFPVDQVNMMRIGISTLSLLCCTLLLTGQSIYTEFGKNRVQYHDDFNDWWMYETEDFVTYWYGKGRNIAQTVIQIAEHDNAEIQSVLEHRFNDKIEIVVYVDITDLKQSNMGQEELFASISGRTRILGNKMFVYFDGNHQNLRQKIREGIAAVYLESMLYGTNFQEVVQNAVLLNLPEWFKVGLISYIADDWSPALDDRMVDVLSLRNGRYRDFHRLAQYDSELAGHSLWYYISRTYGKGTIANILYLTRINRNLDNAILYVLGLRFDELIKGWRVFIDKRYPDVRAWTGQDLLNLPKRRSGTITALSLSPDGNTLAYALNDADKTLLYLYDTPSGKRVRILKTGKKNILQEPDVGYPIFAWHPDGTVLTVLYELRDVVYLTHFDLQEDVQVTQLLSPEYQRVYAMDYWHPDTLVFSASTDGLTNLYKYSLRTRQTFRITEDFYDDLDVRVHTLQGERGFLFASNRMDTIFTRRTLGAILPVENFDIFFLSQRSDGWFLRRLTHTPFVSERQPVPDGTDAFSVLADSLGHWTRQRMKDEPERVTVSEVLHDERLVTHYASSVREGTGYIAFVAGGRPRIAKAGFDSAGARSFLPETLPDVDMRESSGTRDIRDVADPRYLFQSEFAKPPVASPPAEQIEAPPVMTPEEKPVPTETPQIPTQPVLYQPSRVVEFRPVRAIAHRLRFKLDYVTTTMDNSLLFTTLDAYAATGPQLENPPLGILLKANLKDLFEDYIIEGGVRFPTTFNGSEYFIFLDNLKRRIDRRYAFYRKSQTESVNGIINVDRNQLVTMIGQYRLSYPFDPYTSLRGTLSLRNDRVIRLATDISNLNTRIADDQRVGLQLEYVYDNTVAWDINNLHGTRYKVWAEVVKKFDLNLFEPGDKLSFSKGFMTVLGIDARHYEPLDRHTVFASRLYASTSFGSERNLYYLGGVENWLFAQFDNTIPVPTDRNFAFQTIAANMRGFNYNARNGSSVVLINTELRVPFLRYLSRSRLRSAFLRNLQAVAFVDAGTAWHGRDPFSAENPLNTLVLENPPTVLVEVKYFRNPVVIGYGAGVRTMLFGYYMKLDYGWGLETRRRQEPRIHLSLGTDF